jgi:alpha-beta hydrolase superfamily lysophospholipase
VVILFHTITCHTELYSNTAKILASNGFTVVGYDQRGHGRSEGERGYLDDINLMKVDANLFIGAIFKGYPNTPIFLMGHGAGGLLALNFQQ